MILLIVNEDLYFNKVYVYLIGNISHQFLTGIARNYVAPNTRIKCIWNFRPNSLTAQAQSPVHNYHLKHGRWDFEHDA